ncbi:MAG: hypothetical protein JKY54_11985 [Flavobacteriales bacterium]|nr:hypothetical protein [Flavobacteriales bacterium]
MRIIILTIIILSSTILSAQTSGNSVSWADTLKNWLHKGECKAEIYELRPNLQAATIKAKIRESIADKQEWFKEYVKSQDKSKDLPYHEKLGVSKSEYTDYIRLKDANEYGSRGRAKLEIIEDSTGNIRFKSTGHITGVSFVVVDYAANSIHIDSPRSPKATLKHSGTTIDETIHNLYNSPYTGESWIHRSKDFGTGTGVYYQIDMLRLKITDRIFFTITVQQSVDGKIGASHVVPFSFPRIERVEIKPGRQTHPQPTKID